VNGVVFGDLSGCNIDDIGQASGKVAVQLR
jgi:hypothetical protein